MEDPKALALFKEVYEGTIANRIPWEPTADEGEYAATIGGKFTLVIRGYTDVDFRGDREGWPSLVLKDESYREVLKVTTEVDGVTGPVLNDLFERAKRSALKADEKVDELIDALRKIG